MTTRRGGARRGPLAAMLALAIGAVIGALALFALRPVCVPLSADDVAHFNTPIGTRTDRDFQLQVFQQTDGRWYQCKTWLSRQLFF